MGNIGSLHTLKQHCVFESLHVGVVEEQSLPSHYEVSEETVVAAATQ